MKKLLEKFFTEDFLREQAKDSEILDVVAKLGDKVVAKTQLPVKIEGDYPEDYRIYVVKGNKISLKALDKFMAALKASQVGASRVIKFFADGDGAFRVKIEGYKEDLTPKEIEKFDKDELVIDIENVEESKAIKEGKELKITIHRKVIQVPEEKGRMIVDALRKAGIPISVEEIERKEL